MNWADVRLWHIQEEARGEDTVESIRLPIPEVAGLGSLRAVCTVDFRLLVPSQRSEKPKWPIKFVILSDVSIYLAFDWSVWIYFYVMGQATWNWLYCHTQPVHFILSCLCTVYWYTENGIVGLHTIVRHGLVAHTCMVHRNQMPLVSWDPWRKAFCLRQ